MNYLTLPEFAYDPSTLALSEDDKLYANALLTDYYGKMATNYLPMIDEFAKTNAGQMVGYDPNFLMSMEDFGYNGVRGNGLDNDILQNSHNLNNWSGDDTSTAYYTKTPDGQYRLATGTEGEELFTLGQAEPSWKNDFQGGEVYTPAGNYHRETPQEAAARLLAQGGGYKTEGQGAQRSDFMGATTLQDLLTDNSDKWGKDFLGESQLQQYLDNPEWVSKDENGNITAIRSELYPLLMREALVEEQRDIVRGNTDQAAGLGGLVKMGLTGLVSGGLGLAGAGALGLGGTAAAGAGMGATMSGMGAGGLAVAGGIGGGLNAAMNDGDILKGILTGGILGGAGGLIKDYAPGISESIGLNELAGDKLGTQITGGALKGAVSGALHGDPLKGALVGAVNPVVGTAVNSALGDVNLGSFGNSVLGGAAGGVTNAVTNQLVGNDVDVWDSLLSGAIFGGVRNALGQTWNATKGVFEDDAETPKIQATQNIPVQSAPVSSGIQNTGVIGLEPVDYSLDFGGTDAGMLPISGDAFTPSPALLDDLENAFLFSPNDSAGIPYNAPNGGTDMSSVFLSGNGGLDSWLEGLYPSGLPNANDASGWGDFFNTIGGWSAYPEFDNIFGGNGSFWDSSIFQDNPIADGTFNVNDPSTWNFTDTVPITDPNIPFADTGGLTGSVDEMLAKDYPEGLPNANDPGAWANQENPIGEWNYGGTLPTLEDVLSWTNEPVAFDPEDPSTWGIADTPTLSDTGGLTGSVDEMLNNDYPEGLPDANNPEAWAEQENPLKDSDVDSVLFPGYTDIYGPDTDTTDIDLTPDTGGGGVFDPNDPGTWENGTTPGTKDTNFLDSLKEYFGGESFKDLLPWLLGGTALAGALSDNDPAVTTVTSTSKPDVPDWYNQAQQTLAGQLAALPIVSPQYTQPLAAGISGNEQSGVDMADQVTGAWAPQFANAVNQATRTALTIPETDLTQYMNPYIAEVLAPTLRGVNQNFDERLNNLNAASVSRGAFGGSRNSLLMGLNEENRARALGEETGKGFSNAFNYATDTALKDRAALLNTANSLGSMAGDYQRMLSGDVNQLMGTGAAERGITNDLYTKQYTDFTNQLKYPLDAMGAYSGALNAVSPKVYGNTSTTTTTGPKPNMWSNLLGMGATGVALYNDIFKQPATTGTKPATTTTVGDVSVAPITDLQPDYSLPTNYDWTQGVWATPK